MRSFLDSLLDLASLAVGGGAGTVLRFGVYRAVIYLGLTSPWGTWGVNILGSFFIGFLAESTLASASWSPRARLAVLTGVLGGFTTFSALAFETWQFAEKRAFLAAAINVGANLFFGLTAVFCGVMAAKKWMI